MSAVLPAASQSRRAALMAHALPKDDQAWLLAALPPARRSVLEPLLTELQVLGIPSDPALLDALDAQQAPAPPARACDTLLILSAAQLRTLAKVLQQEDPAVAACLLALRRWAWRDALLAAMRPEFAQQVRASASRTPAHALDAALCEGLLAAIALQPVPRFAPGALLQRMHRAFRVAGERA